MVTQKAKVFLFVFVSLSFLALVQPNSVQAARARTRKSKEASAPAQTYSYQGIRVSVRFRPDRLGILLTFSNFDNLDSGSYEVVYNANGIPQGAGGSIILGDTETKELLFATCSGGVCNFHENITNARLSVISRLKNGQTVLKPFILRV